MPSSPELVTEWLDADPPAASTSEAAWQRWLIPVTVGLTPVCMGVVLLMAWYAPFAGLILALCSAMIGLAVTLVGMGWGSMIVFADSTRRGLWFAIFPPYMVYYAVTHWKTMRRPTILFLCGLVLAFGTVLAVQSMVPAPATVSQSAPDAEAWRHQSAPDSDVNTR